MSRVRAIVLRAAGTNCDRETVHALELAGARAERVHVARLAEKPALLSSCQILVLPGGFTYGDDTGAGRILGLELERRLGEPLSRFVESGRLVMGICNGFQVLVRMGLLPGFGKGTVALTDNDSGRFECRWIVLESRSQKTVYCPPGERLAMPVAHGEGKFVVSDAETLARLEAEGQIAFVYSGKGTAPAGYPENPNGSVGGIAGITDATGRVLGLMPHPERHVHLYHHPDWTLPGEPRRPDGRLLFEGAVSFASREVAA
ncbi:MAG: phosphoribosylformylglycinamidine synthase I [Planctomycetes bacterium]|nr:phosphoribosylformylglycinamidine synthase I [Planctomycetota bacterium]